MCTLSIIRVGSLGEPEGLRVVMNRDESRARAEAVPPRWRDLAGGVRAIWPTDPEGGGTWVGATDQGLVLCLLNLNPETKPALPQGLASRGLVIPRVVNEGKAWAVVDALSAADLMEFAPFRLVVAEGSGGVWECRWDREALSVVEHSSTPLCLVSSGLGDSKVEARLGLFEAEVVGASGLVEAQDRFHVHSWAGRSEVSVLMSREQARTVSITTVEVGGDEPGVRMRYRAIPDLGISRGGLSPTERKPRPVAVSGLKR